MVSDIGLHTKIRVLEMNTIDLRSDTMTLPTEGMKERMLSAPLGDDVWGEDPTVNAFQEQVADLLGKESALFMPTATQSNLVAIMSHCNRGEEYIVGNEAHCYRWEAGGAAVLGSVQPQPIPFEEDGTLDIKKIEEHIKVDDSHFAITRLLCLENTQSGKVLPISYIEKVDLFRKKHGLKFHMDGARAFNAAVALGIPIRSIVQFFDSVTLCLSKGLGCPTGALLVGSREFIKRAHRWRKMAGGAMRQAGFIAAAGQYALENHIDRLAEDHQNIKKLAEGLQALQNPNIHVDSYATNMLFVTLSDEYQGNLQKFAKENKVLLPDWQHGLDHHIFDVSLNRVSLSRQ